MIEKKSIELTKNEELERLSIELTRKNEMIERQNLEIREKNDRIRALEEELQEALKIIKEDERVLSLIGNFANSKRKIKNIMDEGDMKNNDDKNNNTDDRNDRNLTFF